MITPDLSFVADALLALAGEEQSAPFELDFIPLKRHARHERAETYFQIATCRRPGDEMFESELKFVFKRANLTKNQSEVLDCRLLGLTFEQIAKTRNITRQGAMTIFLQAIKKIGRVLRVYPYAGLSDVYAFEIRRGLPKRSFGKMKHSAHNSPR